MDNELQKLLVEVQSQPSPIEVAMQGRQQAGLDAVTEPPAPIQEVVAELNALAESGSATTEEIWQKRRELAALAEISARHEVE